MAKFKITFFFESHQEADIGAGVSLGWTETWYRQDDSLTSLDAIITNNHVTAIYPSKRLSFMSSCYRLSFVRVSEEPEFGLLSTPGRYKIMAYQGNMFGHISPSQAPGAQVQCAVMADIQKLPGSSTDKSHHRKLLLRGLPRTLISCNVINVNSSYWPLVVDFLDYVGHKASGKPDPSPDVTPWFMMRYHDYANTAPVLVEYLTASAQDQHLLLVSPSIPGLTVASRDKVRLSGVQAPFQFANKTWNFIRYDNFGVPARAGMVLGRSRHILPLENEPGESGFLGKMVQVRYAYGPANQYTVIGLRNKKTGRVFRQLRGRSSNRL